MKRGITNTRSTAATSSSAAVTHHAEMSAGSTRSPNTFTRNRSCRTPSRITALIGSLSPGGSPIRRIAASSTAISASQTIRKVRMPRLIFSFMRSPLSRGIFHQVLPK